MKFCLRRLLIPWLFIGSIHAQDSTYNFIHISQLPPGGILIDKGWKFHTGDDSAWASPAYDDRSWKSVTLSGFADELIKNIKDKEICWFRIRIYIDSPLRNIPMAIVINQLGASVLYVDGAPLVSLGKILPQGRIQPNNPRGKPFLLQSNLGGDTLSLSIRFATRIPPKPWLIQKGVDPLNIRLSPWPNAVNNFQQTLIEPRGQIAYSFMVVGLGLLFLLLYSFLPVERINILFAAYCFAFAINIAFVYQLGEANLDMRGFAWMGFAMRFSNKLLGFSVLCIIAVGILGRITKFIQYLMLYALVVDTLLDYFAGPTFRIIHVDLVRLIFTVELCRLTIVAFQKKNYFVATVAVAASLVNIFYFVNRLMVLKYYEPFLIFNQYFFFIMFTIYVAYNYAMNSKTLRTRNDENRRLSEEKQQLLVNQNAMLENQVRERTAELSKSLQDLRDAQAQLIQSEKMASLGELTAGIAHEIQNPLNFVNNFAEVNTELIDEMEGELKAGNADSAEKIAESIKQNLEKISHHGKRADSIVKGMLLHSRSSSGQKEPTDINALADEYFRLSYHGLRAKDKMFNATLAQELDPALGKASVVAPDVGRALLNLFNNAFYSVAEKKKRLGDGYEPQVRLTTTKLAGKVQIIVRDNGLGIPAKLVERIFNPFFTSKPAGQGTGLGLSMSYDIITKEHGGNLSVQTQEGEYAEFIIELPIPEP